MYLFWTLICVIAALWGSRRDATGTRIMLLGIVTLYERRRAPSLSPPGVITFKLGGDEPAFPPADDAPDEGAETDEADDDDEVEEEEEVDERDLFQRIHDAGFATIDERRDLVSEDVASIDWDESDYSCGECESDMYDLWEVFEAPSDHPALAGRLMRNPVGHVCSDCGHWVEFDGDPPREIGVLWPLLESDVNFFEILLSYEDAYSRADRLRDPPKPAPVLKLVPAEPDR